MTSLIRTRSRLPDVLRRPLYALAAALLAAVAMTGPAMTQTAEVPEAAEPAEPAVPETRAGARMTVDRLHEIAQAVDPEVLRQGPMMQLEVGTLPVLIVTDASADRMRAMVPIRSTEGLSAEEMMRLMQANFDTALDARYAVAQGRIWSVFIHPLGPLEKDQFLSALGQVVNLATTYGTGYSSGALSFGGGDSGDIQRKLIEDLLKKGEKI